MKTYDKAPDAVHQRAERLIQRYHSDLENSGVTIDFIFANNDTGAAVTHQGYPALAQVRIISLKDRVAGRRDAEILIDQAAFDAMSDEQKDALLDHELEHLIVPRDDDGAFKRDDIHRPKLKMKKHDWQMGWFTSIAERHGQNSPEVFQAKLLWDSDGQAFFPMLHEGDVYRSEKAADEAVSPSVKKAVGAFQKIAEQAGGTVTITTGDKHVTLGPKKGE